MTARSVPPGEGYRGAEGRIGYLLRQTIHAFHTAMEQGLRPHGLTSPQYGALFVLAAEPGLSVAELARAMGTTPQAASLLVAGMERAGLVRRRPHPTHGRILETYATDEGRRRFRASEPVIHALEDRICEGLGPRQLRTVRQWLVDAARALGPPARGGSSR